jgi:hypothetical protein
MIKFSQEKYKSVSHVSVYGLCLWPRVLFGGLVSTVCPLHVILLL